MNSENIRSAIILCGGKSRRMGNDKGSMLIKEKPMFIHILDTLNNNIDEVVIVLNDNRRIAKYNSLIQDYKNLDNNDNNNKFIFNYNISFVEDEIKNKGPLSGLITGIKHINGDYGLVLPCDSPFIKSDYINYMFNILNRNSKKDIECIVPYNYGNTKILFENIRNNKEIPINIQFKNSLINNCEPLHGIYKKDIYKTISKLLDSENNVKSAINSLNSYFIPINEKEIAYINFKNLNSKEDLNNL
ncbi:MAG: molybdenum cofactor guanylyltransferase [Methanobrevibacter sp.]|jgi:molybdopterin-guanine dinucleotide biosynthesis protein A|nr:molybdenum cofactor guanylyltransferase [Methanobrevibacter sp.]